MTELRIHHVERVIAPGGARRDRGVTGDGQAPDSHKRYDFETLFYEAVRDGDDVYLIAPKPLNFEPILRQSKYRIDGAPVRRVSVRSYYRHAIVRLPAAPPGTRLELTAPDGSQASCTIQSSETDFLAGLNVELFISKDNDLNWIRERLTFHAARCGTEGLCFIDTGSTAYDMEALGAVVASAGFKKALIVSMPYPWGGINIEPMHRELYLQTAAYNLCRIKYLSRARAVVRLDVDEVLKPQPEGQTVFDRAVQSRLGFVAFHGSNRVPAADLDGPYQFADHSWAIAEVEKAGNNWCIVPQGPTGGYQWRCHNPERNVFFPLQKLQGSYFYHCLGISTGWQGWAKRWATEGVTLSHDAEAARFWAEEFGSVVAAR